MSQINSENKVTFATSDRKKKNPNTFYKGDIMEKKKHGPSVGKI